MTNSYCYWYASMVS